MATREELDQAVRQHKVRTILERHHLIATAYRELQDSIKEMIRRGNSSSYRSGSKIGWLLSRSGFTRLKTESLIIDTRGSSVIVSINRVKNETEN